jgi:hypothetical protein
MNGTFFEADGHLNVNGISMYVDALRDKTVNSLPSPVLDHVQTCAHCRAEVTDLFAVVLGVEKEEAGVQSGANAAHWWDHGWRLAAAITGLCGVGIISALLLTRTPVNSHPPAAGGSNASDDSLRVQRPDSMQFIAARFAESPELENLLIGGTRSEDTEVRGPENGREITVGTVFRWESSVTPPYRVTIVDNHNTIVRSTSVPSPVYVLADSLRPGLYYWKLIGSGNLMHVGKFVVR